MSNTVILILMGIGIYILFVIGMIIFWPKDKMLPEWFDIVIIPINIIVFIFAFPFVIKEKREFDKIIENLENKKMPQK